MGNVTPAVSRRTVIAGIGCGAGLLLLGSMAADAKEVASGLSSGGDDDAFLARAMMMAQPHILRREAPYRVTKTLLIPAGKIVTVEPGTRIIWSAPFSSESARIGVFEAAGDNSGIMVINGGEAFIECEFPNPSVFAAKMLGKRGFSVIGIQAWECQHVYVDAAAIGYEKIRTDEAGNIARDVRISGGGARFAKLQTEHAGCILAYVDGAHVDHVHYENVSNGIQWWGGDAGLQPRQNGARINERKCSNITIENASIRNANAGGIWGSMGRNIVVRDCRVEDCHDVCFDAEGCVNTTFERCAARNGYNGCFTTFFLCDNIRFVDCRGSVDKKQYPLFRTYNSTQSNADNRRVQVIGGRFTCIDRSGPGTMDSAMGPVQELTIAGATLENVRIDTVFLNMHRTRIVGNTLSFPYPLPSVAAIHAGTSQGIMIDGKFAVGGATVENNHIRYTATTSEGMPSAIEILEGDFNTSAESRVVGNTITGPFIVGISVINATGNVGIVPAFNISGNRFIRLAARARLLKITQQGAHARRPTVRWDDRQTRDGRAVPMRAALN